MRTLVLQTRIGDGSLTWDKPQDLQQKEIYREIVDVCTASVRAWCQNVGYGYRLCRENLNWSYFFGSLNDKQLNCSLQAWHHMPKSSFDQIIFLDNDVLVIEGEATVPLVDFGLVRRFCDVEPHVRFYFGEQARWYNAGVIVMSQERCAHLAHWMLDYIPGARQSSLFRDVPREESLLAEYCTIHPPTELDPAWNTIPKQTPAPLFRSAKLVHLCGDSKGKILESLPPNIKEAFDVHRGALAEMAVEQ